ncbi:hypothetical protein C8R44DRAFT_891272 [Mycena epipterygia]|nr:hypothetical protein C8R44DRAFT_891272 [Mycena epipterygia]
MDRHPLRSTRSIRWIGCVFLNSRSHSPRSALTCRSSSQPVSASARASSSILLPASARSSLFQVAPPPLALLNAECPRAASRPAPTRSLPPRVSRQLATARAVTILNAPGKDVGCGPIVSQALIFLSRLSRTRKQYGVLVHMRPYVFPLSLSFILALIDDNSEAKRNLRVRSLGLSKG